MILFPSIPCDSLQGTSDSSALSTLPSRHTSQENGLSEGIAEGFATLRWLIYFVLVLTLTLTPAARAQSILFYWSVSKGGQVPAECLEAAKVIYPFIVEFGAPKQWTWIVVCDEAAWKQVEAHTGQTNVEGTILGLSNLDGHVTFIRGWAILHPFNERPEYQPRSHDRSRAWTHPASYT